VTQADAVRTSDWSYITRIRKRYRWLSPTIAFSMLIELADIWMIRRMLLNLRERAEALALAESTAGLLQPITPG
jgi:hypothetical protein